ncbi:unnamed protein product [Lampetra fluviatilis]
MSRLCKTSRVSGRNDPGDRKPRRWESRRSSSCLELNRKHWRGVPDLLRRCGDTRPGRLGWSPAGVCSLTGPPQASLGGDAGEPGWGSGEGLFVSPLVTARRSSRQVVRYSCDRQTGRALSPRRSSSSSCTMPPPSLTTPPLLPLLPLLPLPPLLLLLLLCASPCPASQQQHDERELFAVTRAGRVMGRRAPVLTGSVVVFSGVPYGEPPEGERRFLPPEPRKPWPGTLRATQPPHSCFQYMDMAFPGFWGTEMWNANTPMSEDCLMLTLWVPSPRPRNASVMVWIYGGGFVYGTSSLDVYDGKYLAYSEGVVVVSMNYRVGALGFLALPGSAEAPGNAGLFDQQLALRWVHENAEAFGGNPASVTVFGESAGAASVGLHVLSPRSRRYVTRAIMQSGAPNAPWVTISDEEARRRARALAAALSCPTGDDAELVRCLHSCPPQQIIDNEWSVIGVTSVFRFPFVPVVDGDFIAEAPSTLVDRGAFNHTDLLVGVNLNEGSFFLVYEVPGFSKDADSLITREQFLQAIGMCLPYISDLGRDAAVLQYTDWNDEHNRVKNRDALDAMVGDLNVVCPVQEAARVHAARGGAVYVYRFEHRASNMAWPEWMGVVHGYEIEFVFGLPVDQGLNYTAEELALSRNIMRYWANFAKTGNPAGLGGTEWPTFSAENPQIMALGGFSARVQTGLRSQQCAFWNRFMPKLMQSTATLDEAERQWKEEFSRWSGYMLDWKSHFDHFSSKREECARGL